MYYVETRADNSLEYLFTVKRGTNYNKADDPVICISRVICPCFDIVHRNLGYFFSIIPLIVFEKWTLTKNLTDPDADDGVTTIARLFFFEK
jgi:hypothetical protein